MRESPNIIVQISIILFKMTPEQKLIQLIVKLSSERRGEEISLDDWREVEKFYKEKDCWEAQSEIRHSGVDTDILCGFSRHYDVESRAVEALDGTWIGYNFYSGGGKFGEPEAIEWIKDAYEVKVVKEEMVVKRFFEKI